MTEISKTVKREEEEREKNPVCSSILFCLYLPSVAATEAVGKCGHGFIGTPGLGLQANNKTKDLDIYTVPFSIMLVHINLRKEDNLSIKDTL